MGAGQLHMEEEGRKLLEAHAESDNLDPNDVRATAMLLATSLQEEQQRMKRMSLEQAEQEETILPGLRVRQHSGERLNA